MHALKDVYLNANVKSLLTKGQDKPSRLQRTKADRTKEHLDQKAVLELAVSISSYQYIHLSQGETKIRI